MDDTLRDETDLEQVDYNAANADADANFFNPSGGTYGWYLRLRPNEKVTTAPIVVAKKVFFGTFEATDPGADEGMCHAGGVGRLYFVYYNNVNPVEDSRGEVFGSSMVVGTSSYTMGGTTYALANTPDLNVENKKMVQEPTHRVTNWRQE
ncbi:MAG: hypothetical protein GXP47_13405 [Acidobacteria bacterium]|nr:hypothetical protein [Acidobacteriota bacterium]